MKTMRLWARRAMIAAGLMLALAPNEAVPAEEARRELGAHVHGEAHLAIGFEENRIQLEFQAPADDIVGFEHAASSDAERAALADARTRLAQIATLVTLVPSAGCRQVTATVTTTGALAETPPASVTSAAAPSPTETQHGAFEATYTLECPAMVRLNTLEFVYFKSFSHADKLEVTAIGPKGQASAILLPTQTRFDLGAIK